MLILVSLMAASLCAQSQNRIQDTPIFPDNNSIVRVWQHGGTEYWVTCSYGSGTTFYLQKSTNLVTSFKKVLDTKIMITDIEIFGDVAYFCGLKSGEGGGAVFGQFTLPDFTTCTIEYLVITSLASFNRLDVYEEDGFMNAVLTAGMDIKYSTMVHAFEQSAGSWIFYIADRKTKGEQYDDVLALKNKIIFTCRHSEKYREIMIWNIPKPAYPGMPIFQNPVPYYNPYNPSTPYTTTPVLAAKVDASNYFAIVNSYDDSTITVSQFEATYGHLSSVVFGGKPPFTIKDITFTDMGMSVDVLTNRTSVSGSVGSNIFHIPDAYFIPSGGGIANAHLFDTTSLLSIWPVTTNEYGRISVGHTQVNQTLRHCLFRENLWSCANKVTTTASEKEMCFPLEDEEVEFWMEHELYTPLEYDSGKLDLNHICGEQ